MERQAGTQEGPVCSWAQGQGRGLDISGALAVLGHLYSLRVGEAWLGGTPAVGLQATRGRRGPCAPSRRRLACRSSFGSVLLLRLKEWRGGHQLPDSLQASGTQSQWGWFAGRVFYLERFVEHLTQASGFPNHGTQLPAPPGPPRLKAVAIFPHPPGRGPKETAPPSNSAEALAGALQPPWPGSGLLLGFGSSPPPLLAAAVGPVGCHLASWGHMGIPPAGEVCLTLGWAAGASLTDAAGGRGAPARSRARPVAAAGNGS